MLCPCAAQRNGCDGRHRILSDSVWFLSIDPFLWLCVMMNNGRQSAPAAANMLEAIVDADSAAAVSGERSASFLSSRLLLFLSIIVCTSLDCVTSCGAGCAFAAVNRRFVTYRLVISSSAAVFCFFIFRGEPKKVLMQIRSVLNFCFLDFLFFLKEKEMKISFCFAMHIDDECIICIVNIFSAFFFSTDFEVLLIQ